MQETIHSMTYKGCACCYFKQSSSGRLGNVSAWTIVLSFHVVNTGGALKKMSVHAQQC